MLANGIYKKNRPRRILKANPKLSKKVMPHFYLKGDKEFLKTHTPFVKQEEEAKEDFDADAYYHKDFRELVKEAFGTISTKFLKSVQAVMAHDIGEFEKGIDTKEEALDDRSL